MVSLTNSILEAFVSFAAPVLIISFFIGGALIFYRKVSRGHNGMYKAIMFMAFVVSANWLLLWVGYTREVFDIPGDGASEFLSRLGRALILFSGLVNLRQIIKSMKKG